MSVIELGLVTADAPEPPAPDWRHQLPRFGAGAVAVLCALTLTGSVPPRSQAPLPLWSVGLDVSVSSSFAMMNDGLYVLAGAEDQRRLTRYDPRTGATRWSVPVARLATTLSFIRSGVIQLPVEREPVIEWQEDGSRVSRTSGQETVGIDTATGQQLWTLPGDLSFTRDGRAVIADWDDTGAALRSLRVVDVHSGATVWTHPGRGLRTWAVPDDTAAGLLVTAANDGQVEVRDLAGGRLVTSRRLPQLAGASRDDTSADLGVAGDVVLTQDVDGGKATLKAYDTMTMRELWHLGADRFQGFFGCAPVLCITTEAGTSGHDLATGQKLWQREGGGLSISLSDGVLMDQGEDASRSILVDTGTGRTIIDLEAGGVAWNDSDRNEPVAVLLPTRAPPGNTAVGRLDQRTGRVTWRGLIDPVESFACRAAGTLMACTTGTQLSVLDLAP
ncbi:outer membrane protein assembly factor BamB family protein [Actinoplanes friuliensis]|uniref:Pyrrolo-quinoline quinone repeat domain-containing protein n=1 Tax=Actinoplanes friuliensis DSM 7358 TaxID=1246995 RepID=U5W6P5_9ACTN|nr:PQQ-binding-like beta-propeller repeat protein [Actinoplanes friuliensis]AGZ44677.1 hypothetical protein AFR_32095 [Actinoplanes friuliensis DSM 7358]